MSECVERGRTVVEEAHENEEATEMEGTEWSWGGGGGGGTAGAEGGGCWTGVVAAEWIAAAVGSTSDPLSKSMEVVGTSPNRRTGAEVVLGAPEDVAVVSESRRGLGWSIASLQLN